MHRHRRIAELLSAWKKETMTSHHDKPKRWRPKFSVRTSVIVITLVCCYAACWGPTKKQGNEDVSAFLTKRNYDIPVRSEPIAPLLLRLRLVEVNIFSTASPRSSALVSHDTFYLWLFGYVVPLPYERVTETQLPQSNSRSNVSPLAPIIPDPAPITKPQVVP